jgi:hypothetical protein
MGATVKLWIDFHPTKHNSQGRGKSKGGRSPSLESIDLFTDQFFPTKPAIPASQEPKLPLKEIVPAVQGHFRE